MNELQNFNFRGNNVRTLSINDELYFVGNDVTQILGYSNYRKATSEHVDKEDKLRTQIRDGGQNREFTVINESGLYSLILSSKLQSAKEFKRWVTNKVLPTIRKHGAYLTDQKIEEVLTDPDTIIKLATQLKEERTGRLIAEQQVQELQPKATYYDLILRNKSLLSISKISKDFGMSPQKLNSLLHEYGVQYKQGGIWLLYSKYQDRGYTQSKTFVDDTETSRMSTYWTQAGRIFIYDLLKEHEILPMIERQELEEAE